MTYTILVLYLVTPDWLALTRAERNEFFSTQIGPVLEVHQEKLSVRFFDSEAFHGKTSDYMIITCEDLRSYYYFMEALRDTKLFSQPYLVLNDVIIGIENGFKEYEAQ